MKLRSLLAATIIAAPLAGQAMAQGAGVRPTLTSGVSVMRTSVANATRVYITPHGGGQVPIYDPSAGTFTRPEFPEVYQDTTDTTQSPAAVAPGSIYDVFCYTVPVQACSRGPAWAASGGNPRGYTLTYINGIALNTTAIANGPGALRGTWVATIKSNAGGTIDWIIGTAGPGGVAGVYNVWSVYNREPVECTVVDNSVPYPYMSNTIRQAHSSAGMQVSFVLGEADTVSASYSDFVNLSPTNGAAAAIGVGFDRTNGFDIKGFASISGHVEILNTPEGVLRASAGAHFVAANQQADNVTTTMFGGTSVNGLTFKAKM